MAYIGNPPITGNFQVCDAISVVNGQAAYTMQVDSANVTPESANHMLVSLNGILQKPGSSFTISGSTITFASNLATGDVIDFIMLLGNVLDLGVPSDATVTNAKTNFTSTSSAAGLQIKGDGTTDGTLQLNCSQNSHGIKLASPAHSAGQSYTLTFPTGNVTADKFLKVASVSGSGTTGIGQLSFDDAGGGQKTLLLTSTISSGTASVVINNTYITSTYRDYFLTLSNVHGSADGEGVNLFFSTDNGSSYTTGTVHRATLGINGVSTSVVKDASTAGDALRLTGNQPIGNASGESLNANLTLYDLLGTDNFKGFTGESAGTDSSGNGYSLHVGGTHESTTAVNAIKIQMGSGTLESGIIKFYGIT
jgi:hypothetical protein